MPKAALCRRKKGWTQMRNKLQRFIAVVLLVFFSVCFCACETEQEKANREIAEATAAYEKEKAKLNALEDELEYVQWQIEQAEKNGN